MRDEFTLPVTAPGQQPADREAGEEQVYGSHTSLTLLANLHFFSVATAANAALLVAGRELPKQKESPFNSRHFQGPEFTDWAATMLLEEAMKSREQSRIVN